MSKAVLTKNHMRVPLETIDSPFQSEISFGNQSSLPRAVLSSEEADKVPPYFSRPKSHWAAFIGTCRSLEIALSSAGTEKGGDVLLKTSHHSGDSQFASDARLRETQSLRMTCL
ncbi:hypothetical protein CDAR_172641 [Caerostris darwini]|uniref:Uncharacterized protein n=1 Tax=Caerostris darwini TaxID=1538125 RepID=A0AAV4MH85_9ARAC|nr:hypothetical protein CDAR_172641 [Caerostris darwini]